MSQLDSPWTLPAHARAERPQLPPLLVAGDLAGLDAPCVAVVGTRAPSEGARRLAYRLGFDLGRAGVCVISGLAMGIDGAAHEGAVGARAFTIGVLGGGHRRFYPRRHRRLAEEMIALGGAVVSPYAPEVPPMPYRFLERNDVIAALAHAVVVVEAAERSGALRTADTAARYGLPVLAVPGDVDRPKVAGCLGLLRDGAILVRHAEDILDALPAHVRASQTRLPPARREPPEDPLQRALVNALAEGETALDALLARTGVVPDRVLAALLELELDERIEPRPGSRFALREPGSRCTSGSSRSTNSAIPISPPSPPS